MKDHAMDITPLLPHSPLWGCVYKSRTELVRPRSHLIRYDLLVFYDSCRPGEGEMMQSVWSQLESWEKTVLDVLREDDNSFPLRGVLTGLHDPAIRKHSSEIREMMVGDQ